jgi:hypothetical protein
MTKKLIGLLATSAGSGIGWWIGGQIGIMSAFMVSMVGVGAGMYATKRIIDHWGL